MKSVNSIGGGEAEAGEELRFGKKVFVALDAKTGCYPGMAGMGAARRGGGRRRRILGRRGQVAH